VKVVTHPSGAGYFLRISFALVSLFSVSAGHGQTTNAVTNGGTVSNGVTAIITNPVTSITGPITNNGTLQFWQSTGLTNSFVISGTGALAQNGIGTTILNANNSCSGPTIISDGALQIGTNGTTGALGAGNITNNASLIYNLSSTNTLANLISGTGTFTKRGSGKLTLSNTNTYTGTTTIDNGNLSLALISDPFTSTNYQPPSGTIIVNNGGTLSFGGSLYYNQLGGHVTSATNPFTPVIVNSGGVVDSSGTATTFTNLVLNGGTLRATGGFNSAWGCFVLLGKVTVTSNSVITNVSGANNAITPGARFGNQTVTMDVTNGATLVNSVPIQNYSAPNFYSVIKSGAGTLQFSATNTYTGTTAVNEGTLQVTGSISSSATTVNSNATISGSGT